MSSSSSILFIEFTPSHTECLHAAVAYLKHQYPGCKLHLAIHHERCAVFEQMPEVSDVFPCHTQGEKLLPNLHMFQALKQYIKNQGIQYVYFNTAHGSLCRNFSYFLSSTGVRQYGLLHNGDKFLRKSGTQRMISRNIKRYFALTDYIADTVRPHCPVPVSSYYATCLPASLQQQLPHVQKPAHELWIAIPGSIELKRRSYDSLIHLLNRHALPSHIRFLLLGNATHPNSNLSQLKEMANFALEDHFQVFYRYLPSDEYYAYLQASDVILPLIHPHTLSARQYASTQISGSFNMAWTFRKPLLMHNMFKHIEDFRDTAFFYDEHNLVETLRQLPELLTHKDKLYTLPKWVFDYQAQHFCEALFHGSF
ncbi:MAG: hypothetical protein KatS3mg033_0632 [Thermonema sp.]|uniref:hypothetical protein n=1 Tax=Thermonema sp. TaxID=2231181 RepID=UPI0021DD4276|nr:hypothetical protein [Thermonema sp.]GIV38832.1 MAG: hypothetical protein KatS3mg033_0632 [Thermonema sp.]